MRMCEDAPCCGCCGVGPGGVIYTYEYEPYEPGGWPHYEEDDEDDEEDD